MDYVEEEFYNYPVEIYLASYVIATLFCITGVTTPIFADWHPKNVETRKRNVQPTVNTSQLSQLHSSEPVNIARARKIQRVMIPESLPSLDGIDIRALFLPSGHCGGDLYDVIKLADDSIALLLFNVEGVGLEPILVSAMAKICFVKYVNQKVSPYTVIERVNSELSRMIGEDLKLTAFIGYLDLHDLKLTYCTTGATSPVLFRRATCTNELLTGHHASIGASAEISLEDQYVYLQQGDSLIVFSDGVYSLPWVGATGEALTIEGKINSTLKESTAVELLGELELQSRQWNEKTVLQDDASIICIEILTQSRKNQIKEKLGFKNDDKVYLQFINYLEEMDRATATILSALDIAGFQDEDIRKMKIVLTELLVNAIVHGNNKDHSKKVIIGHLIDQDKAVVSVLDEGCGFDISGVPDPTLPENLEKPCGRGLFIVKHYVESIEFNTIGNRVTVIKKNLFE